MTEIVEEGKNHIITHSGKPYAKIISAEGASDSFTPITDGVWKWHRHTDAPTDSMRMEMIFIGEPTFTMVPSVSYNGNGFGDTPEYVGDFAEDGTLVVRGALTPTGSQFEAVFHTRWGRRATGPFVPTGLYPSWPCAFRLENLRYHKDWSFFDEGLEKIEGKIKI